MKHIFSYALCLVFIFLLTSCDSNKVKKLQPKTDKEKLVEAFKLYVEQLDSMQLSNFDSFKKNTKDESGYKIEQKISRIFDQFNMDPEKMMAPLGSDTLALATNNYSYKFRDVSRLDVDFSDLENNYWELLFRDENDFDESEKFGLTVHFMKIPAPLADRHAKEVMIGPYKLAYKAHINGSDDDEILLGQLKEFFLNKGSAALQFSYKGKLVEDNVHTGGLTEDHIIRTIFNVGRVCPPICPDLPGGQILTEKEYEELEKRYK